MTSKFLKFFEPLTRIMPEAKQPDREIQFKEKLLWTLGALIIYLIMSQVPLFGVQLTEERSDYFYWMRIILASSKNSLCELGIGPIVTSGLIMQLLAGAKIINVNMSDPVDRGLFTGVQKVITILFTIVQSIMYIGGGQFGTDLDMGSMILIFLQLISATVIILLLDEMIQKGWGIGSGVSLFIASNVAGQIFWNSFAFIGGSDGLPRGAFMAFFQSFTSPDHTPADVFIRPGNEPGVLGILTTILIFLAVIYVESMRIEIPLSYSGYSGMKGKYPMKLMYVSNIPVILSQAMYANILFFIQLACGPTAPGRSGDNPGLELLLNLLGVYEQQEIGGTVQLIPINGLAYYLTPPQGLGPILTEISEGGGGFVILHAIVYLTIFILLCVGLGKIWVEVSGLAPRDIAGQIIDSKMQIDGFRRSEKIIEKVLKRYIPTLTILNGIIVGVLSFSADFLGALGSGTGLLLMVGIMNNYAESMAKEAAAEQYPAMRGFLGLT